MASHHEGRPGSDHSNGDARVEGILINAWSDAEEAAKWVPLTCLIVVASLHFLLAIVLVVSELSVPERILGKAVEVQEQAKEAGRELRRREEAYRMVRECLTQLTRRTCDLPTMAAQPGQHMSQRGTGWCQAGFEAGLRPIIDVIISNIATTLGVVSSRFTIEVHLQRGYLFGPAKGDPKELCLRLFASPYFQPDVVKPLTNDSPASLGELWDVPNEQHIQESKALFYEQDTPKQWLYFRRFATCPITQPCSDIRVGVLVLTSMQDDPFATDVLDTLQFISSIVSNYVAAFCDCHEDFARLNAVKGIIELLPHDRQGELARSFGLPSPRRSVPVPPPPGDGKEK